MDVNQKMYIGEYKQITKIDYLTDWTQWIMYLITFLSKILWG